MRPSEGTRGASIGGRGFSVAALVACLGPCFASCTRAKPWPGPQETPAAPAAVAPAPLPTRGAFQIDRPLGAHPRILLTSDRLAALRAIHQSSAPEWRALADACDEAAKSPVESGYEAWDWVNATLSLALCFDATAKPEYAKSAVQYFRALLDDKAKVGDGAGGDSVVHHDDGYSIRTRGAFGAIAYDWLHDFPGMTDDLRKHAVDRMLKWITWYSNAGYNRDQPISNYYAGYFGAVAFGGIALGGDDARSAALRRHTEEMFEGEIVPAFRTKLEGGDFPEGWQYGDLVGAILAVFADAESARGGARSLFDELPWLRAVVAYRAHALWPDGKHTFDTGDWSDKPAVAPPHALLALSLVLPSGDPLAAEARTLARAAADPKEEWSWLVALAAKPASPSDDPRRGPTSRLAPGTGVVTARTDWSPDAVWLALASAPSLSDHQHLDAGHFEIVRGGDALVIDAGGYGAYSSLSHNVIAVDDKKENDDYAPSQGTWSTSAKIARFEDRGPMVYALADYASAYNPSGYPNDHPERSVTRAEREVVFSRSPVPGMAREAARVVVYDRITLAQPGFATTFLLHGGAAPQIQGGAARFAVGRSQAVATTLLPIDASPASVREPTNLGDGAFYDNDPPDGTTSVRLEVRSPTGDDERRFLNAIVAGDAASRAPSPLRIEGEGADGVAIADEAYVFERGAVQLRPMPVSYRAPPSVQRHLVASLVPDAPYAVAVTRDGDVCRVDLRPGPGRAASHAGTVLFEVSPGCTLAPPSPETR